MINKLSVLFITVFALLFTSCVTKKKYLEMQDGRLKAEQQVRELTRENDARAERIRTMIADFEAMKNELLGSNAEKDEHIDNLNKEIAELKTRLSQQEASIEENTFTYGFEKERLSETLLEREKTIRTLEAQVKELERDFSQQGSAISERNLKINVLTNQVEELETEISRYKEQQKVWQQQVEKLKLEIEDLNKQLKEKDETITRLQNNVNLLKKELGGN